MLYLFLSLAALTQARNVVKTQDELFDLYNEIFPHGNRNAASHRWANFVLEEATDLTVAEIEYLFGSFCPVSGSPISANRPGKSWELTLPDLQGEDLTGVVNFCCEPCVCDTEDMIKVDPTEVQTAEGPHTFNFLVIGDPCVDPSRIAREAPDVTCENADGSLDHAQLSANGGVIIGMLLPLGAPAKSEAEAKEYCSFRAENEYQGGMGQIFRNIAAIQPLGSAEAQLSKSQYCSPGSAGAEYAALQNAVQSNAVVLAGAVLGTQHYRCYVDAEQKLDHKKVCYKSVDISDALWDYLKCLYPDERTSNGMMHSYLYIGGEMVGNGFVVDPRMDTRYTWAALEQKMRAAGAQMNCGKDCSTLIDPKALAELKKVVAEQPVVMYGWEPCPCVGTARDRFMSQRVCFVENTWTDQEDQKMKYLQCVYGAEHHSFIWFNTKNSDGSMKGGEFIGDGFALGTTVMSDAKFSSLLKRSGARKECQGKEDKNLFGTDLHSCSDTNDVGKTGWTRTGSCVWQSSDRGFHEVCVEMTDYFIKQSAKYDKNDLSGVVQQGGHWCICAWAWASAVQRDPENFEGITLECERTNARLRNVYEAYISSNDEICGPGGRCYEAKAALDALNKMCPPTGAASKRNGPTLAEAHATVTDDAQRAPEATDGESFVVLAAIIVLGSLLLGAFYSRSAGKSVEAIPMHDDMENIYESFGGASDF